jgi:large subunit ribosomal protein L21
MFAVVETGGKQYKVSPGQTVAVEKLPAEPGETVELGRVLLISTDDQTFVGTPNVEDAKIVARVADLQRGPKIIVFRYKSKSRYRRKTGHRQDYSLLTIEDIWANGASLLPAREEAEAEPEDEEAAQAEAEEEEAAGAEVEEAAEVEEETVVVESETVEVEAAEAADSEPAPEPPKKESRRGRRRASKEEE